MKHIPDPHNIGDWQEGVSSACHIHSTGVRIGGVELPKYIAEDGVFVDLEGDLNRVTVTFLVGEITIDDKAVGKVKFTEGAL